MISQHTSVTKFLILASLSFNNDRVIVSQNLMIPNLERKKKKVVHSIQIHVHVHGTKGTHYSVEIVVYDDLE
jgi:hypothetical protein